MAIATTYWAVITRFEWKLRDLLTAVGTGPGALYHWLVPGIATLLWLACAVAVTTLEGVEAITTRLERQLGDLLTTIGTGP
jgi:hypothetical protein